MFEITSEFEKILYICFGILIGLSYLVLMIKLNNFDLSVWKSLKKKDTSNTNSLVNNPNPTDKRIFIDPCPSLRSILNNLGIPGSYLDVVDSPEFILLLTRNRHNFNYVILLRIYYIQMSERIKLIFRKFLNLFYIANRYLFCDGPKEYRACGDVICKICGKKYYDHLMDGKRLSRDGYKHLHILCNSDRVHL